VYPSFSVHKTSERVGYPLRESKQLAKGLCSTCIFKSSRAGVYPHGLAASDHTGKAFQTADPIVLFVMTTGNTVLDPLLGAANRDLVEQNLPGNKAGGVTLPTK
jgi:hypothetical protein